MRSRRVRLAAGVAGAALAAVVAATALADGGRDLRTDLIGFEEVPAVSTDGEGKFRARVVNGGREVRWELSYEDLSTAVQQAHIHFGQRSVNGGISVFLCSDLGNGPVGTQGCPDEGTIEGEFDADDVIGPAGQGIAAMELDELMRAIRAGVAYANVHTSMHPGGEIRGQFDRGRD